MATYLTTFPFDDLGIETQLFSQWYWAAVLHCELHGRDTRPRIANASPHHGAEDVVERRSHCSAVDVICLEKGIY